MATMKELSDARTRTSMQSPDHLKRWLDASGRRWLVVDAREMVDALPESACAG